MIAKHLMATTAQEVRNYPKTKDGPPVTMDCLLLYAMKVEGRPQTVDIKIFITRGEVVTYLANGAYAKKGVCALLKANGLVGVKTTYEGFSKENIFTLDKEIDDVFASIGEEHIALRAKCFGVQKRTRLYKGESRGRKKKRRKRKKRDVRKGPDNTNPDDEEEDDDGREVSPILTLGGKGSSKKRKRVSDEEGPTRKKQKYAETFSLYGLLEQCEKVTFVENATKEMSIDQRQSIVKKMIGYCWDDDAKEAERLFVTTPKNYIVESLGLNDGN